MGYAVLSVNKMHSTAQLGDLDGHIKREFNTDNVDLSKSYQNKELVSTGGLTLNEAWARHMQEAAVRFGKMPLKKKNSVRVLEIITGVSHDDIGSFDVNAWAQKNVAWMKETFGEENILSCTLHMDESTPHIHTEIIPITKDGRLCAKDFTAGKGAMVKMQDSYAKAMSEFGLLRGERRSKAKKVRLEKFYGAVNRAEELKLPPVSAFENLDDYVARMEEYLHALAMENLKLKNDLIQQRAIHSARMSQAFSQYTDAVALYDELKESFGDDEEMVRERLCQYRRIEKAVPRKSLDVVLDGIEKKFPIKDNIFVHFMEDEKKKRLGIETETEDFEI